MNNKSKSHDSYLDSSNTELRPDESYQHTPVKSRLNENNYSKISFKNTPKSASSINKYRYNLQKKDHQTAHLMISSKIASEKDRQILYTSTMNSLSPYSIKKYEDQRMSGFTPSTETDTSSIKGFESHVFRMRTPPKKDAILSPSSKVIIPSQCPRLTPTKQEEDKLSHDIDEFLEQIENKDKL